MTKTFHSCGGSLKAFAIMAFSGLLVLLPAPSADAAKKKGGDYCAWLWGDPNCFTIVDNGAVICCCKGLGGDDLGCFALKQARKRLTPTKPKSDLKRLDPIPGSFKTNPRGPMSVGPMGPRNPVPSLSPRRGR